jgi:signal transduction histidine kinase
VADPSPNLAAVIAGWPEASAFWQQLNEAAGLPTLWLGDGPSVRRNVLLVDPLGALRNFSITQSVLPAHTVGERRAGRLISVKDETERRARERMLTESSARLEAALREAQAASDAKTALLAGVSHELRTPLFTILGYAELVQETAEDNGYTAITTELGHIREAGKQLRQRIGDLLDLTEIESGTVKFTPRNIQLHELVREAIESVDPQIKRHQSTHRLDVEGLPARIVGDRLRIRQILVHLLSNAAKFAPGGQVQVQGEVAAPTPERPATLLVRVIDNGVGIAAAELPHIFEDFYQSRRDARHRPEGAGLGLTISRRLARAMGGDITVVSAQGSGSTFTLHLPLGPTS